MITSLAVRLATVRAIRGKTIAEERVFDSAINELDQMISDDRAPLVVVYTDEDQTDNDGRDLMQRDRQLSLMIEIAVADRVVIKDETGDDVVTVSIPNTDAGIEASLNILERQVMRCLLADTGVWPELWRTLVVKVHSTTSVRGATVEEGVRFGARQINMKIETLSEPGFGAIEQGSVWETLTSALHADPDTTQLADAIEASIVGDNLTGTAAIAAMLGINRSVMASLGETDDPQMTDQEITDMENASTIEGQLPDA